jgi:hypothetical protein
MSYRKRIQKQRRLERERAEQLSAGRQLMRNLLLGTVAMLGPGRHRHLCLGLPARRLGGGPSRLGLHIHRDNFSSPRP